MRDARFRAPTEPARIADWWHAIAAGDGDRVALIDNGRSWTLSALEARAEALARGLSAQGAGKGSRIGILFPNRADWLTAWLATTRIGAIAVTLSTFFAPPELAFTLHHADVSWLLSAREYLGHRYDERLLLSLPGLAAADGSEPLALAAVPHLRGVWFDGPTGASWAAGTLDDLAATAATCPRASAAMVGAMADAVVPADTAMIIYTSGSTAAPKGVVHSQANVARKLAFMAEMNAIIPFEVAPGDRMLVNTPLFWVGGFLTAMAGLALGAAVIFDDDHGPAATLRAMREFGANSVSGSEGQLRNLHDLPDFGEADLHQLKPQHTAQLGFFNRFAGSGHQRLTNSLGMTETLGPHSGDPAFELPPDVGAGTFGFALDTVEYRIVDPSDGTTEVAPGEAGELCVRALWLMDGFYKRERSEAFDRDGYYHTGDKCRLLADGRLLFEGRLAGMIKTSGANVSPEEVELVLCACPGVLEASAFGLPDPDRGEVVVAVVVRSADSTLDEEALRKWSRDRLSAFKVPRRILFRSAEQLPRTPSQKIRRPALAEMVGSEI